MCKNDCNFNIIIFVKPLELKVSLNPNLIVIALILCGVKTQKINEKQKCHGSETYGPNCNKTPWRK